MPPPPDELDLWDYPLPPDRIARHPAARRPDARLMHVMLSGTELVDHRFSDLPTMLRPDDLLVVNNTKVMAARIRANRKTGGAVELLILEPGPGPIRAMARPARKLKRGEILNLSGGGTCQIVKPAVDGIVVVAFDDAIAVMEQQGSLPLPPYLHREAGPDDTDRYQTVYAGPLGAAAAPTAGLHFDQALLDRLADDQVRTAEVTLHVGLATFRPLREADIAAGKLHTERFHVPQSTVEAVARARECGGRVIAVGTTSVRALESAAAPHRLVQAGRGETDIFLHPPKRLQVVDGLITNFHLPRSSLLMLVACLVGRERLLRTYRTAIARGYRFYSYGDAMLLL